MEQLTPQKKLSRACAQLMIKHPFFGSLVYQHDMFITDQVETAGVSGSKQMMFNPDFIDQCSTPQLMFIVAHEVMHIVFAHVARKGSRDHKLWNIACDAVINEILVSEGVGEFVDGGIRLDGAETETSEKIYALLSQNQQNNSGSGNNNGDGDGDSMYSGSLTMKDLPEGNQNMTESEIKSEIAEGKLKLGQAAAMARMQGKMGSGLSRIVDQILESRLPWYQLLERYITAKADQRYNWSHPHRRRLNICYMPSRERIPSMGSIVLGIDVSGSISDEEVAGFVGHCKAIFELCHPKKIYVVYCTTRVEAVDEFESGEEIVPRKNMWCGGTYMPAIMDWIEENDVDPDVCVTFTDGYTDYPNDDQVPCELVWVLSTKYKPGCDTHGEVIYAVEESR